jgi:ATP-dependent helicase/nuclease subunit B
MTRLIKLFDVSPIAERLVKGGLFLTPNQRLASRITAAYAIDRREHGSQVSEAPQVYSLATWIEQLWERLLFKASPTVLNRRLLSAAQEQVLWEKIVGSSMLGTALLRPAATASQAISAYRTMIEWQQDFSAVEVKSLFESDDDATVLLSWAEEFEIQCREQQWLPRARQAEYLIKAFEQGELDSVPKIIGVGFDDITPLHRALIDAAGEFEQIEPSNQSTSVSVVGCDDIKQELICSAVWAKKILRDEPEATVALVIADLGQQRQTVQRILQEVFEPEFNQPGQPRRNLPFNMSAGYPLVDAPVISAALDALKLSLHTVEIANAVALCQSPFYCLDEQDSPSLTRLISRLYDERVFSISSSRFRQLAREAGSQRSEQAIAETSSESSWPFASVLQEMANSARVAKTDKPRSPSAWLPVIQNLLKTIGWPGSRRLDSTEYQQVSQWQSALEQLCSLDNIMPSINFSQVIVHLRGILSRQVFQPQTVDSSLQVLGTLEAAGLQFSHLWLLSMSGEQWPPQPAPNPLIPFSLQRETSMPHATAERELIYAKRLTERFVSSAKTVVVSYPVVIDDNPAEVSRLFKGFEATTVTKLLGRELNALLPQLEIRRRHLESATTEAFDVGDAPHLTSEERVSGGSQLFANQSACPFRAFAGNRLKLSALPVAELGLSAADRGSLLHRSLELVWEKLKSQQNMLQQSDQALQSLCLEAAEYSLNELSQRRSVRLGPRFTQLESSRLQHLLLAWLAIEKQREPFVVQSIETRQAFRFAELELHTRIDRIDKLDDGRLLIIDYKTGNSSVSRWWGERPDEPQLPLYNLLIDNALVDNDLVDDALATDSGEAVQADDCVGGIAFAQIRADGCELKGIGAEQLAEPMVQWRDKVKTDAGVETWPHLKQHWQKVLSSLARDFISGKSAVDPKQSPQTCQYCDLASVCRVNHRELN